MAEKNFKDLFSDQSAQYKTFRPQYPESIFKWLATQTPSTQLAWDCGTGNGQAAVQLARYFKYVIATDPSAEQLKLATTAENIEYRCEVAEHSTLTDRSADLVCIAQALHWFDFESFYREVRRVVKPGGIICGIAYGLPVTEPTILEKIKHLHNVVLKEYWDQERQLVADLYKDIPFPFESIATPPFSVEKEMTIEEITGYLKTWSGLKKMIKTTGQDPMPSFTEELRSVWPAANAKVKFVWNLALLCGRV